MENRKEILFRGKKISYIIAGQGRSTLVLVHGFPETATIFERQITYLQHFAQIIVPDLPGAGLSEYNPALASVEDFADAIVAILDAENTQNIIMIGHSMGGYITLALEEKYPERLAAFGLLHSTALTDTEDKKEMRQKSIHIMEQFGAYPFVRKAIPNLVAPAYRETHPEAIEQVTEKARSFSTPALQLFYRIMIVRPDRTHVLKTAKPVFFVIGQEDNAAPLRDLQTQIILPDISAIHILDNVGHLGMLEATENVNQYLKDFLLLTEGRNKK